MGSFEPSSGSYQPLPNALFEDSEFFEVNGCDANEASPAVSFAGNTGCRSPARRHISGRQIHITGYPTVHEMHQVTPASLCFRGSVLRSCRRSDHERPNARWALMLWRELLVAQRAHYRRRTAARLVEPVFDEETIITAERLSIIDKELLTLDAQSLSSSWCVWV